MANCIFICMVDQMAIRRVNLIRRINLAIRVISLYEVLLGKEVKILLNNA